MPRPDSKTLLGQNFEVAPASLQRVLKATSHVPSTWIGPKDAVKLSAEDKKGYELAHKIMCHLCVQAPTKHSSGHPGGSLSSFTFAYFLAKRRNPTIDQPLRYSAGHLSLLAYGLQWMFGRNGKDERLQSPQAIIDNFRIASGLPGHVEAGIGDIPFGFGPLGKATSHGLGTAFGLKYQKKIGVVDVLLGDGDCQEGQVAEAFRLAPALKLDNLVVHGDMNDIQLSDEPSKVVSPDFAAMASACGWNVIEVQNGNDPGQVIAALDAADKLKSSGKPTFICYYTTMGNGVRVMEDGSNKGTENFHGTPLKKDVAEAALKDLPPLEALVKDFEPYRAIEQKRHMSRVETDVALRFDINALQKKGYKRTVTDQKGAARKDFGETHLKNLMKADDRIVVLHADLAGSGGFDKVQKEFPHRVVNVGVAEANMYMMAAGMRQAGLLPVTYTFAAFGTNEARANARLIDVNCGHTRCAVLHDCTHAGLSVGEDGETHQDRNYVNLPFDHTQVWMPVDSNQAAAAAERAMELIAEGHTSVYTFYARSGHEQLKSPDGKPIYGSDYAFDGRMDLIRGGSENDAATIIAMGIAVHDAVAAADRLLAEEKISIRVLNAACIRPLDASAVMEAALETGHVIVVEDHHSEGGLATQIADVIADFQLPTTLRRLGVNHYFPSASDKDLKFLAGLDAESILNAVLDEVRAETRGGEDAFVTAIFSLKQNAEKSRFCETAKRYIGRLMEEKTYMERLRERARRLACPEEKFPSTEELQRRLAE